MFQESRCMAKKIDFYQIYYEDSQKPYMFDWTKHYLNTTLTPFFENSLISNLVLQSEADKIAVTSWALKQKMTARIPPRRELTEEVLQEDFDVMSFTKNAPSHDMLGALDGWHPGSVALLAKIWDSLGLEMPKKTRFPIYQNAFCASHEVYLDYVVNFLIPAMYLMEFDQEIKDLCYKNSGYTVTTLNKPVDFGRINKYLGIDYYPMHPFILERCFSLWIERKNLKVVYL